MLSKTGPVFEMKFPVRNGGTTIPYGGFLMPGVTADTDLGLAILATSAGLGTIGRLKKAFTSAETDSTVLGTTWNFRDVELCAPFYVDTIEYDQTDTMAVASTSTTTVTVTSLEDNIDTSWLYAVSGTGAGLLAFLVSSASGSATSKTATGWDSTTVLIKMLRNFHRLAKLNTTSDKIGTDAAAGSWTVRFLANKYKANTGWQYLDPTKHDNVTLPTANAKFYAEIAVLSSLAAVAS